MIYPDRANGVRLVTDPVVLPHRITGGPEVYRHSVTHCPKHESGDMFLRIRDWRVMDNHLTTLVRMRLAREERGE